FLGSGERQTGHSHPTIGTPAEVPVPRKVNVRRLMWCGPPWRTVREWMIPNADARGKQGCRRLSGVGGRVRMGARAGGGNEMGEARTLQGPPMTVVERAKAFLAGTLEIPPLKLSDEAAGVLEMMFKESGVVPTEKARRQQTDALATQEHYAGK